MDIQDERQFREFVGARSKALPQTAYLLTGDWEHSRDLVQGALAGLARRWGQLADPERAEAYVRKAIYHAHVDRTRLMSWRRERSTAVLPETAAAESDPADVVAARWDVMRALRRLPRGQRAVVVLRYFEDRKDPVAGAEGGPGSEVQSSGGPARVLRFVADVVGAEGTVSGRVRALIRRGRRRAPSRPPGSGTGVEGCG